MMMFDSSAIINVADSDGRSALFGGATLPLAEYEIGNFIWNRVTGLRQIDEEDALKVLAAISAILHLMEKVRVRNTRKALRIALEEKITYYDAAFLAAAMENKCILVTDDQLLRRVARKYVETRGSDELSPVT